MHMTQNHQLAESHHIRLNIRKPTSRHLHLGRGTLSRLLRTLRDMQHKINPITTAKVNPADTLIGRQKSHSSLLSIKRKEAPTIGGLFKDQYATYVLLTTIACIVNRVEPVNGRVAS